MLNIPESATRDEIVAIVERHGADRTSLIPILQDVKKAQHEITDEAMQIVADLVGIHPVEVFSVATFYAFLHGAPEGRYVVRLCGTLSCDFAGKTAVAKCLTQVLQKGLATQLKGNNWKGPFHLPRMQWYCWRLVDELLAASGPP